MSNFHVDLLSEINRLSIQKVDRPCTNKFRPYVSSRLKLIHRFQVFISKLTYIFSKLSKGYLSKYQPFTMVLDSNNYFVSDVHDFERAYIRMGDELSKKKYIHYIAFNYIRRYGARLNFDSKQFSDFEKEFKKSNGSKDYQTVSINNNKIYLPYEPLGFVINFRLQQYAYQNKVVVESGDVVLDCGAANGDTALYFAAFGAKKIYSFEFLKENTRKFSDVMSRNRGFKESIELIERAIWHKSNIKLSVSENGNASSVLESVGNEQSEVETITIDEFISQKETLVDFIKMDIEGAELNALKGAKETILKYRPKLAICVYHKDDDLVRIPDFIHNLDCNYEFYFDYYTDTGAEAVLYARVAN